MNKTTTCLWCKEPLRLEPERGWVHADSGMAYVMSCPNCKWTGAQPARQLDISTDVCPNCGAQGQLHDDHVATPASNNH